MKHLLIVLVVLSVVIFASPMYAQITFERWYGGVGEDGGYSVAQTSDGGYIVAGYTYSYGAGSRDVYLVKPDALGDTLWTRTYGGTLWDAGNSVAQTSDGGYIIAGETDSYGAGWWDVYLIKTDSLGDTLWTRTYGGTILDCCNLVAQTSDGGYIIAGWTTSYGAGLFDIYLIKTDSLGLGIQEEKEQRQVTRDVRFTISPNPFTDKIRINLGMYDVGYRVGDMSLQIYDISGGGWLRYYRSLLRTPYSLLKSPGMGEMLKGKR